MRKKKRILSVLSGILGNKVLSDRYLEVFRSLELYDVDYFYIDGEDYKRYPARGLTRFSEALRLADIASRKYQDYNPADYDILFINGYEIAFGLIDQIKTHHALLGLDVTPRLVHELLDKSSNNAIFKFRSKVLAILMGKYFFRLFSEVNTFLPMTEWCGNALMKDYNISKRQILTTYVPSDLDQWMPRPCTNQDDVRLLFVGNHFERKGGDLLLNIFQKHLQQHKAELILVSNDQNLNRLNFQKRIKLFSNISNEKLIQVFQSSDIFVFPTRKEYLGVVATEACCAGLPVIARDVGGLKEFIIDGYNGFLMPYDSSELEWLDKIQFLIDHPEERERMGNNSRRIAEEKFNLKNFCVQIKEVLDLSF